MVVTPGNPLGLGRCGSGGIRPLFAASRRMRGGALAEKRWSPTSRTKATPEPEGVGPLWGLTGTLLCLASAHIHSLGFHQFHFEFSVFSPGICSFFSCFLVLLTVFIQRACDNFVIEQMSLRTNQLQVLIRFSQNIFLTKF